MSDLISRKAAIKLILSGRVGDDSPVECPEECNSMLEWAADKVAKMPTAEVVLERRKIEDVPVVAVAPAVRCEYCKYCLEEGEFEYWCYGFCSSARLVRKDDFCSYWKAKNIVPFHKCQGCAYLNPKHHYCEKYIR